MISPTTSRSSSSFSDSRLAPSFFLSGGVLAARANGFLADPNGFL
jgi:hypothetical protein